MEEEDWVALSSTVIPADDAADDVATVVVAVRNFRDGLSAGSNTRRCCDDWDPCIVNLVGAAAEAAAAVVVLLSLSMRVFSLFFVAILMWSLLMLPMSLLCRSMMMTLLNCTLL